MSTDPNDKPAIREPEAEVIDFDVVDDGQGSATGPSLADFAKAGPEMLVEAFRGMLKEKLKRWFIRSLIWATVLLVFAPDHAWARWAFGIWSFIAGIHLAVLVYGWYASGKQGAKLAQIFGGMGPVEDRQGE